MFSSWSRTPRSTPPRAVGASLTLRTESRATKPCTRPASPATPRRKIATTSSPITPRDERREVRHIRHQRRLVNEHLRRSRLQPRTTLHREVVSSDSKPSDRTFPHPHALRNRQRVPFAHRRRRLLALHPVNHN